MAENRKSISMEIRADGGPARSETAAVARDVAAMKRKTERDVMAITAGKPVGVPGAASGSPGGGHFVYTADGSQAMAVINGLRAELAALAKDAATPIVIAAPRMAAGSVVPGRSAAVTPGSAGVAGATLASTITPVVTPPAVRRPLSLRAADPAHQQYLSDRAAKAVLMTIRADGGPARTEARQTVEAVNAEVEKVKPLSLGGVVKGALGGAYGMTFRGLGSDITRGFGLDKVFGGMNSGLGKMASLASFAFTGVFRAATFTFSAITGGLRMAGNLIMSALTAPLRMAATAFKTLGIAAASAAAGVYAGLKALRPAADMQQYQIQMEVLLKDPAKAKARLAELTRFAKETNYGPAEIIESANLMEAFGIYGGDISRLKLAGDAANAFGKDIREVVRSVSYLSSGRTGEAVESLSRIGVSREKLKPFGVEFSKSGEMTTEPKKAIDAVFRYFAEAFGGMTARQAKTWKGAIQQLGGEVYDAFARGFKSALGPLTQFVTGNVIPMIDAIGDRLQAIKWDKLLSGPMRMLGGMTEIITKLADPTTAAQGMAEFKGLGSDLWAGAKTALSAFGAVGMGLLKDLGGIFEAFVGEGGIGKIFALAWDGLKLAMEGGAGLFKIVLSGFSAEFLSGLKMALDAITGVNTGEAEKRAAAEKKAREAVFQSLAPGEYKRVIEGTERGFGLSDRLKNFVAASVGEGQATANLGQRENTALQYFKAQPGQAGAKARAIYDATIRSEMGWDGPRGAGDPMAAFNAQREKFAGSLGGFMGVLGGLRGGFGNTGEALNALPDLVGAGFAPATGRLSRNAREAALRAQGVGITEKAKEYDDKAASRLSALRQVGWQMVTRDDRGRVVRDPMTGKLVPFETERRGEQAAAARREYYTVAQQRRQVAAGYQVAYRDTVSERLGLTGERKEKYWSLVDRSREEYRQYYRRYEGRVQAGDTAGAAGVRREWAGRLQGYRQESGNLVKDAAKPGEPAAGDQARAEKSLGDMAVLLAQQKILQTNLLAAMQGVESTLKLVLGVA